MMSNTMTEPQRSAFKKVPYGTERGILLAWCAGLHATALRYVTQKVRRIFAPSGTSMRRLLKNRLALAPARSVSPFVRHTVTLAS